MTQFPQRLRLYLANTLAGDREILAHFFKRVLAAIADAKTHFDHLLFARRQRLQYRLGLLAEVEIDDRFRRRHRRAILDEVAEMRIFFFTNRCLERNWLLRNL